MALKTISGSLQIPASEANNGTTYTDLTLYLIGITTGGTQFNIQFTSVSVTNEYTFEYDDALAPKVIVRLVRTSSNITLSESKVRGVLPRSFKLNKSDLLYNTPFIHKNWLVDAGLSVIAASEKYKSLAEEITEGIKQSELTGHLPFSVNHVIPNPSGATQEIRTGSIALVAYSLGWYFEKNPLASNIPELGETYLNLLMWLSEQRQQSMGYLLSGGKGRMIGNDFDEDYVDTACYTIDNIYAYYAFAQAGKVLGNATFSEMAARLALSIKERLYDSLNRKFSNSVLPDGSKNNSESLELYYMAAFFFLSLGETERAKDMLDIHLDYDYKFSDTLNDIQGYKLNKTDSKLWFEGSYAVACLLFRLGDTERYGKLIKQLNKTQDSEDGSFRLGIIKDGLNQVLTYKSVGSTAWSYIAGQHQDEVFNIRDIQPVAGLPLLYGNAYAFQTFIKDDCPSGSVPTAVKYEVPPGKYWTSLSQVEADAIANDEIQFYGQDNANANGTCSTSYSFYNTERTALFMTRGCPPPSRGQIYSFTIPAGVYGSNMSVIHANALADTALSIQGQAYADAQGGCVNDLHLVPITFTKTHFNNGSTDECYATINTNEAVETSLSINFDYTTDGGATWAGPITKYMSGGSSSTGQFWFASVSSGGGNSSYIRISNVTPGSYGSQIYSWANDGLPVYSNELLSAYFIKNCPTLVSSAIVQFSCSPGLFTSHISQQHANSLGWAYVFGNGQAYAENTGSCGTPTSFGNDELSQTFTKQGCSAGYSGTQHTYTVAANTYTASSKVLANALAQSEIDANGQSYVNSIGSCELNGTSIFISPQLSVNSYGIQDELMCQMTASQPVPVEIAIEYSIVVYGTNYLGGQFIIPSGSTFSTQEHIGSFPSGSGSSAQVIITGVTPNPYGSVNFVF